MINYKNQIKTLSCDLETYSSINLFKSGVYKYCESDDFEILLFAYSINGEAVQVVDLASGEKIPLEIISAIQDEKVIKWAFNAMFERICLSKYIGYPIGKYLSPTSWRCTMIWSAYLGLPLSLEGAGAVLGLDKQKLKEGKELIRYFCIPCKPTIKNEGRTRNYPTDDIEKWENFVKYNIRDVEVELGIKNILSKFPVPDFVWDEYHVDQLINDTGVLLDMEFVQNAIEIDAKSKIEITNKMINITELENPNSVVQMKNWLNENGLKVESLGKKEVKELIEKAPPHLQEILELRLQLSKSSIKKYQAMQNTVCADNRARGMFQFYGANRTGRFAGRNIQLQNLVRNKLEDLQEARDLVKDKNTEALKLLYEDIPDTLSQLIRTAFIAGKNKRFIVADYSAIEAQVIAWFANEKWRLDVFKNGGDIYCASASKMFKVPVEKHGVNGHLRQKGKQAELACIAEGELVLTNKGLIPIEKVTTDEKLWDGESWVNHKGVIYKGIKEVIEYEGLKATAEHQVWVEGKSEPIQFIEAAAKGLHLLQTGNGRSSIWLGENNLIRKKMEQNKKPLLCFDTMSRMQKYSMATPRFFKKWEIERLSAMFSAKENPNLVRASVNCSKTEMREPQFKRVQKLWSKRNKISLQFCNTSWFIFNKSLWDTIERISIGQNRLQPRLYAWKSSFCKERCKSRKQEMHSSISLFAEILALLSKYSHKKTFSRFKQRGGNSISRKSSRTQKKKLENNRSKIRVYDIRDAGRYHRFTVSNCLVHNCGYGGSVGALKAMGAIELGLKEEELKPLVDAWRVANPEIVKFWWAADNAAKNAVKEKTSVTTYGIKFFYQSGILFIKLPSTRTLSYIKPRIGVNQFGGECITYEGTDSTKSWSRINTYGPKIVENIVQATSRDILCYAMKNLSKYKICMHIHDEVVIEAPKEITVKEIIEIMTITPPWAKGLLLNADAYETEFYKKD